jgi:tellurite resistance protein TerC
MTTIATPALWTGFGLLIVVLLAVDLRLHRVAHVVGFREALAWTIGWIVLALLFNAGIYLWFGTEPALQFLAGYLVEKALSVDNIFVFVVLFESFAIPPRLHHRVLFWGIIGALVMRGTFIAAGAVLLARFHWFFYVFGVLLVATGVRLLLRHGGADIDPRRNPLYRAFAAVVPMAHDYSGDRFLVRGGGGRLIATPLLAALVAIEAVDVVFALDSIPAIFAITTDPFIVLTSNAFAIFGLRTMFFMLGGAIQQFRHLGVGLALVLMFVGGKMLASGVYDMPIVASLAVIVVLIAGSIATSLWSGGEGRARDGAAG